VEKHLPHQLVARGRSTYFAAARRRIGHCGESRTSFGRSSGTTLIGVPPPAAGLKQDVVLLREQLAFVAGGLPKC
jgi:hypothetical protein